MIFDEWWATKNLEKANVPGILKNALKDLSYEAWCESRYQQKSNKVDPADHEMLCPNYHKFLINQGYNYCSYCKSKIRSG